MLWRTGEGGVNSIFAEGTGEGNIASGQEKIRAVQGTARKGRRRRDEHELAWSPRATSRFLGAMEEVGKGACTESGVLVYQEPELSLFAEDNGKSQRKSKQGTNKIRFAFGKITLVATKGISEDQIGVERILIHDCKHPDKRWWDWMKAEQWGGKEGRVREEWRGKLNVTVTTDAAQHGVAEQSWRGLVSGLEAHLMHERTKWNHVCLGHGRSAKNIISPHFPPLFLAPSPTQSLWPEIWEWFYPPLSLTLHGQSPSQQMPPNG